VAPSTRLIPTHVPWLAVITFLALSGALAWAVMMPVWLSPDRLRSSFALPLMVVMMFTPLTAALLVAFFVQKPRPRPTAEYLGLWPLRPAGRVIGMSVVAVAGGLAIVVVGVFLAAALGLVDLDLVSFSGYAARLAALTPEPPPVPIGVLVALQLVALPAGAVFNGLAAIGEELGWRGWLLPTLQPLGTWPTLLLTGTAWGLWHSPLILLGYNLNRPDLSGVAVMVVACVVLGVLLGWLRLRTGSVWPAVFGHGAFNAAAGFLGLVSAAGSSSDPTVTGPLGGVTWIVMGLVIITLILTGQFAKQPRSVLSEENPVSDAAHDPSGPTQGADTPGRYRRDSRQPGQHRRAGALCSRCRADSGQLAATVVDATPRLPSALSAFAPA